MNFLLILLSTLSSVSAQDPHCDFFKYCGSGKTSSKSHPNTSTSANFNPSSISSIKGIGLETLYQHSNPLGFNLITGNGKIGGAVISTNMENSFFGNRSIEIDEVYLQRRVDKKRYKNKKINLAVGFNITSKKNYSFDLGLSFKRNPDIKKINPGIGATLRLWNISIGSYFYKDDTKIELNQYINPYTNTPYSIEKNSTSYSETFTVRTFSIGTKFKNLSLDYGLITTQYDFYPSITDIQIYSAAYNYQDFLFNFAYRKEESGNAKDVDGNLKLEPIKKDFCGGIQYLINKHFLVGVGYNNFLLNEFSTTLTIFL